MADKLLFHDGPLDNALEAQVRALVEEVRAAPEEHLRQVDQEAWAAALARRYAVEPPALHREDWHQDPVSETQVDVSQDQGRAISDRSRPFYRQGFRARVHVPFSGERDVFFLRPNQFTFNRPRAAVGGDAVVIDVVYLPDREVDIRARVEEVLGGLEQWLGFGRPQIEEHNGRLHGQALAAIHERRARLEEAARRVKESGIPVRAPDDVRMSIAEVIVRRPNPLPARAAGGRPMPLEPSLGDEVYADVLAIIRQTARDMERRPAAYAGLGEEELRHHLLTPLNVSYRGQATAEAFNQRGKTDILLRHEGQNLFIGECKFWSGAKGFLATIDQLFGYAAWRDTKLAVVMFVREKDLSAVVEKARKALATHPNFKAEGVAADETELRARMSWPGDEARLVDLNVFLVHIVGE